jgi:hypothetical protein
MRCAAPYRRGQTRVKANARHTWVSYGVSYGVCGAAFPGQNSPMKAILQTNDPVRLSFLAAVLRDAGIDCLVLDAYASAIEGSISAIPRRLVVAEEDAVRALAVLREVGET